MKKTFIIGLTMFILVTFLMVIHLQVSLAGTFNPSIGTGFRCGNLLMKEGLQKAQVVYNCGEPFMTEKSIQTVITGKSFCYNRGESK
jgi:hypothetical protein